MFVPPVALFTNSCMLVTFDTEMVFDCLLFYTICFQVIELSALTPKYNLSPDKRTMPNVPVISVERIKQYDIQEFVGRSVILSFFSQMQICGTDSFL